MSSKNSKSDSKRVTDELDIVELAKVLLSNKLKIIIFTAIVALISIVVALKKPDVYRSSLFMVSSQGSSSSGLASANSTFGGLASLAGINLNAGAGDPSVLALEILKSRKFITEFVEKHNLQVPLMAVKGWNSNTNKLVFDETIYDHTNEVWVGDEDKSELNQPSSNSIYKEFLSILFVASDTETGVISVSIEHFSPELATLWLELIIVDLNQVIRDRDINEAKSNLNFLNDQLEKTQIAEMKSVFYELVEEQTKKIMLAHSNDEYIFTIFDPAVIPEERVRPNRSLIVVVGTMLGGLISVFLVLFYHFFIYKND